MAKGTTIQKKGLKITTIAKLGLLIGAVFFVVTLYALFMIIMNSRNLAKGLDNYTDCQNYINRLQSASDYMTSQVRMYVITGDPQYIDKYFSVVDDKTREHALEGLEDILVEEKYAGSLQSMRHALEESNALMNYELHAMKQVWLSKNPTVTGLRDEVADYELTERESSLSALDRQKLAYELVFGDIYQNDKSRIDNNTASAVDALSIELVLDTEARTHDMSDAVNQVTFAICILFALVVSIYLLVFFLIVKPLKAFVRCIEEDRALDMKGAFEFRYLATTYNNIYEINKESKANMKFKIEHDALTQVFSRQAFEDQKILLSNAAASMALLMIDVDKFKNINDTYGHEKGDEALVRVANTLKTNFRSDDIIARIGGDEFAVLVLNVTQQETTMITNKINRINYLLSNPTEDDMKLSLSVGIAFSDMGYTEEMFKHADQALYHTKENGRAGYTVFEDLNEALNE